MHCRLRWGWCRGEGEGPSVKWGTSGGKTLCERVQKSPAPNQMVSPFSGASLFIDEEKRGLLLWSVGGADLRRAQARSGCLSSSLKTVRRAKPRRLIKNRCNVWGFTPQAVDHHAEHNGRWGRRRRAQRSLWLEQNQAQSGFEHENPVLLLAIGLWSPSAGRGGDFLPLTSATWGWFYNCDGRRSETNQRFF